MSIVSFKDVSIEYKNGKGILQNDSFQLNGGDVILLEGNNGSGKSSLIKTILGFELYEKRATGEIIFAGMGNVLSMSDKDLAALRRTVCYLKQKDEFDAFWGYTVFDVVVDHYAAFLGRTPNRQEKALIEEKFNAFIPAESNVKLKNKITKLSGGQQRLVSIFASLCLKENVPLFLIDEPLNNLDIGTVKHISNLLNKLRIENPDACFVIISHCKIFPFINKVATIKDGKLIIDDKGMNCYACFGKADDMGYYHN